MNRLLIHVEGPTEEAFVNNVLASHLLGIGYISVSAKIIGNPRNQGGICAWPQARRGLLSDLRSDPGIIVPGYTKPLYGVLAAIDIGLDAIRRECPHFREWLELLESLPISIP